MAIRLFQKHPERAHPVDDSVKFYATAPKIGPADVVDLVACFESSPTRNRLEIERNTEDRRAIFACACYLHFDPIEVGELATLLRNAHRLRVLIISVEIYFENACEILACTRHLRKLKLDAKIDGYSGEGDSGLSRLIESLRGDRLLTRLSVGWCLDRPKLSDFRKAAAAIRYTALCDIFQIREMDGNADMYAYPILCALRRNREAIATEEKALTAFLFAHDHIDMPLELKRVIVSFLIPRGKVGVVFGGRRIFWGEVLPETQPGEAAAPPLKRQRTRLFV
jgi:hypothetical protein